MISIEGLAVLENSLERKRIEIDETTGLIVRVSDPENNADLILNDEIIFPGFIDLHVHAREDESHTQEYKEDFKTAGEASINGGVVLFADMPNNPTPPVDDKTYLTKKELTDKSAVPVLLYAAIGPETKPLTFPAPYKVFMGKSIGDMFFTNSEDLERALKNYEGMYVSFHCEDPMILKENENEKTHENKRPARAEKSAVSLALSLIKKYKLHGKICHASTHEAIEEIKKAKEGGVDVSVEVTPHHLFFDETMFDENLRKRLQVNPPIRQSKENRMALIKALKDGTIDYLATDHAPHTLEEKELGISGMPHLDTYGAFTTWLMREHGFTENDIARVSSKNPGLFIGNFIKERYGQIEEGYVGSLSILDTKHSEVIKRENLHTKSAWSPFENIELPGKTTFTIIRGKIYKI